LKLAEVYQQTDNVKKAKEIYSKVLKVSSKAYEAYYQMALLEQDRQEAYLKRAVAINPKFKDGWIDLARVKISRDDFDEALSYLSIAKYIDENDYRYYYYLGLVLKNKGLITEAKSNFEKSLNLNPEYQLAKEELSI
jgi:tetratricopeptide (TPR) repeat protein